MVRWCSWGTHGGFQVVGISLQVVKRIGMVASRWCWVADGGAVLLGSLIAGGYTGGVACEQTTAGLSTLRYTRSHLPTLAGLVSLSV